MVELKIEPRFCETDALGHINNTIPLEWFEQARKPIFKIFTPDLDPQKWRLILVKNTIEYLKQIHFQDSVTVKTYLSKIGNSSMIVEHELYQRDQKVAHGTVVMVHFNYSKNQSEVIPDNEKDKLKKLLK